jgi:hypothetical protein
MSILDKLSAVKSVISEYGETGNFGEAISAMNQAEADEASAALKALNLFAEENPKTANILNVSKVVDYIDQKAYDIGSTSASATRSAKEIDYIVGDDPSDVTKGAYGGRIGSYTGVDDRQLYSGAEAPDLLKVYLGMEENTFPMSEVTPSSWTQDTPEQGWRSIKEYSDVKLGKETSYPDYFESFTSGEDVIYEGESQEWNMRTEYLENESALIDQFKKLRTSVEEGTYDPSKHAVKMSAGEIPPGLEVETRVNVGNFTQSIGYDPDKKEYYYSMTDVWDFEPEMYAENWSNHSGSAERYQERYNQAALMEGVGKSVGFYDRYTIPDEYIKMWGGDFGSEDITDQLIDRFKED